MSSDSFMDASSANEPDKEPEIPVPGCALDGAVSAKSVTRADDTRLEIEVVQLDELTTADRALWNQFRSEQVEFRAPFMSLEFLKHSQAIGRTVEVSVLQRNGKTVGFFPFERRTQRSAVPVAAKMNDVHGVLGADLCKSDLLELMRQSQLDSFAFHAWFRSEEGIDGFSFDRIDSFMADLKGEPGYDLYSQFLMKERYTLKQQIRKTRKFQRDVGPVRLEFRCSDQALLEKLFQWKRAQFQRTHTFDIFSVPWTTELVRSIFNADDHAEVRGVLSVLFVNDQPSAMHVGIQEGNLLHYWFPVYDPQYSQYSPGAEMFLRIADECQQQNSIEKIDLGYGEQPYKHKLINRVTPCHCGLITKDRLQFQARRLAYRSHQMFRTLPFKDSVKSAIRSVFPAIGRKSFL